jgi:hypothetical protein
LRECSDKADRREEDLDLEAEDPAEDRGDPVEA